jgi:fibronectin type 3 domain-containing protein
MSTRSISIVVSLLIICLSTALAQPPAMMTSPTPGSTLTGSSATFQWNAGTGATAYWLDIGNVPGGNQYEQSGNLGNVLTLAVNGLPTNGNTIYATLYSLIGGQWFSNAYTYTAFNAASNKGVMTSPTPSTTLTSSSVIFQWSAGTRATAYWLDVGSTPGGNQYEQSGSLPTTPPLQLTVNTLPTNGSTIYATLYSLIGGQWFSNAYTYTAFNAANNKGVMTSPTPSTTLTSSSVIFQWSAGTGATAYWLDVGSTPGGNQYEQSGSLPTTPPLQLTVNTLPTNGSTIYATLYSMIGGQWLSNAYTYTAFNTTGGLAVMQTPAPGSTLSGNTATFTWSSDPSATAYWLDIGSVPKGNQYYQSGNLGSVLTTTVYSLPANGSTIYATLYSLVGGQWLSNAYTYVSGALPTVTSVSPNSGSTLGGTAVTITGTNFAAGATVTFGGTAATNVVVVNSTTITATAPAGSAGAVTVTVTNPGAQSGSLTNGYTYAAVPTAPSGLTAGGGGPGPIVDAAQSYLNTAFLTSHTTAPFDSTGGDLIVLLASSHFGLTFTPSDNFGNTWISIAGPTNTSLGFDLRTQVWYAPHPIVGPGHTITMNLSGGMALVMSVIVVKGSDISSPIDAVSLIGSDNGTQTVNVVSPNINTTSANDLLIGFVKVSAAATFQSGPGFTPQPAASLTNLEAETEPAAVLGTYNATFTLSQTQTWQSAVVAVANNPNQTSLSWTASTEPGGTISDYLVERCQGTGCSSFVQVATTTTTSYNDTGLTASTSYSYRVRAQDANGNLGPYSAVTSVATPALIPSLPGNLTATSPSSTEIVLSWSASTETGGTISDYLVERCQGANCTNFAEIGTSSGTTYNDTGLTNGDTYNYEVQAKDAAGNLSPYSNVASATAQTPDTQPPTAPSNLTATAASSSQINLSWTASTDNEGVTSYDILRCEGAGCTLFFRVAVSVGTGTTYSDTGLSADQAYAYEVQATDAAGNLSPYSNVASATTQTSGAPGFTLLATPAALSVVPGTQGTSTITTTLIGGFSNSISLSASGMPSGTTVSFNPSTIAAPGAGNSTMTITVGSTTAVGTYPITVTGNGEGVQETATVTLTVATAIISYVQGNYATPQTAQTTVSVPFTAAQAAGDLNVVVVGWNNSTATVSAVTDALNNSYTLAVGPTVEAGVASQSIYYAKNIAGAAAGANTVTVIFASAAAFPDIRILEYHGADLTNPVDVTVASTGNSATSSSGAATTTNAADLLFGANLVGSTTTGPGSGFASRLLTQPDGDIAEDTMVTATGSYSATAPINPSNPWIMQMVAFRAASAPGP